MKEKRECKVIQDLLPNYIEGLTNEETNKFIEEHLENCIECKEMFKNMKKEFKVDSKKIDTREVKYIKKFSNKLKVLKFTIVMILLISLGIMIHYYFYWKDAYLQAANRMVEVIRVLEDNNIHLETDEYGNTIIVHNDNNKDYLQ